MDADKALDAVFDTNFRFRLDNPILDDHGVFYPLVLYNHFVLEMTLAPALQVVKGSDALKLVYRLAKIQMEYETIHNTTLADKETTLNSSGKAFAFDQIMREEIMTCNNKDSMLNNRVDPQRRSLKGILLLLIEPYIAGARDSEKYINPDITKVSVTVSGSPNKIYNNGIEAQDRWQEISPVLSSQRRYKQNVSYKVLQRQQVWVVYRPSLHVEHPSARKRRPPCEHQRRCVP